MIARIAIFPPFLILRLAPNSWLYSKQFREAAAIISKIEKYKEDHKVYPENLSALGIAEREDGPYYYNLREDGTFRVWFSGGGSFFACQTYNSTTREWYETD